MTTIVIDVCIVIILIFPIKLKHSIISLTLNMILKAHSLLPLIFFPVNIISIKILQFSWIAAFTV